MSGKSYVTPDELHADLVLLVRWLADDGYTAREIADAIEKPWCYAAEIEAARVCVDVAVMGSGS